MDDFITETTGAYPATLSPMREGEVVRGDSWSLFESAGQSSLEYDSGELAAKMVRQPITAEEAAGIRAGTIDVEKLITAYQNRQLGLA